MTFQEVYREHFRFVWRSLRRLGVLEDDMPDAVQDVFIVVHRRLAEFEARSKMTTWLFSICMNVATARRRVAHVRREVPTEQPLANASDETNSAVAAVERAQGLALLERILDQLPMDQRVVFALFELEEKSSDEIAELLEIPRGTVHSRLRLAREAFRQIVARMQKQERFRLRLGEAQ